MLCLNKFINMLVSDIGARDVTARVTMVPDINERALNIRVA